MSGRPIAEAEDAGLDLAHRYRIWLRCPAEPAFLPQTKRHAFGLPFDYRLRPNAETYGKLLSLARKVKRDLASLRPRDMIDIQSFLWIQGSDEYPD